MRAKPSRLKTSCLLTWGTMLQSLYLQNDAKEHDSISPILYDTDIGQLNWSYALTSINRRQCSYVSQGLKRSLFPVTRPCYYLLPVSKIFLNEKLWFLVNLFAFCHFTFFAHMLATETKKNFFPPHVSFFAYVAGNASNFLRLIRYFCL